MKIEEQNEIISSMHTISRIAYEIAIDGEYKRIVPALRAINLSPSQCAHIVKTVDLERYKDALEDDKEYAHSIYDVIASLVSMEHNVDSDVMTLYSESPYAPVR